MKSFELKILFAVSLVQKDLSEISNSVRPDCKKEIVLRQPERPKQSKYACLFALVALLMPFARLLNELLAKAIRLLDYIFKQSS